MWLVPPYASRYAFFIMPSLFSHMCITLQCIHHLHHCIHSWHTFSVWTHCIHAPSSESSLTSHYQPKENAERNSSMTSCCQYGQPKQREKKELTDIVLPKTYATQAKCEIKKHNDFTLLKICATKEKCENKGLTHFCIAKMQAMEN